MRVNSIQFLRGIAALLVVYEHSMEVQIRYGSSLQQDFYFLDNFGCIGVDLFFVISGFIITYVANKYQGIDDGLRFLEKRFYRVNPIYYIASLIFMGIIFIYLKGNNTPLSKWVGSLLDTLIIVPASGDVNLFNPILVVGWTLAFEWLFYIYFFLLILAKIKNKTFSLLITILLFVIIGALLNFNDFRLQFITNPIMLEFVLGVFIYHLYMSKIKITKWVGFIFLALGVICYLLLIRFGYGDVWYYKKIITGDSSLSKFFFWGLPSSFIVAGSVLLEKNGHLINLWSNRWMALIGNASYSIYLIHFSALLLFRIFYRQNPNFHPSDLMIWIQLIIAVAISIVYYKLVEKPLLNYFQKKPPQIMSPKPNIIGYN